MKGVLFSHAAASCILSATKTTCVSNHFQPSSLSVSWATFELHQLLSRRLGSPSSSATLRSCKLCSCYLVLRPCKLHVLAGCKERQHLVPFATRPLCSPHGSLNAKPSNILERSQAAAHPSAFSILQPQAPPKSPLCKHVAWSRRSASRGRAVLATQWRELVFLTTFERRPTLLLVWTVNGYCARNPGRSFQGFRF